MFGQVSQYCDRTEGLAGYWRGNKSIYFIVRIAFLLGNLDQDFNFGFVCGVGGG